MTIAIRINGSAPQDLARALAADERGFHYGDGVFETALLRQGEIRFLDAHLARLSAGCERLGLPAPDPARLRGEIADVVRNLQHGVLKIVVTRGSGQRGYRPPSLPECTRFVALYAAPPAEGPTLHVRWCETRLGRNALLAGIKHLNRLEQVMAQREWHDPHVHEGLMLDTEGEVVCATASNMFVMRDDVLVTPDLRYCGVRGIMRAQVLRAALELGIRVCEEPLWPHDVEEADELFLTNAVRGIRPVASLGAVRWTTHPVAQSLIEHLKL